MIYLSPISSENTCSVAQGHKENNIIKHTHYHVQIKSYKQMEGTAKKTTKGIQY